MVNKVIIVVLASLLAAFHVTGQEPEIEDIVEQQAEYSDISELLEMLAEIEQNPIHLNSSSAEELAVLPWISKILAIHIINYRKEIGKFVAIEQLNQIPNFNPDLIPILRKYITVDSPPKTGRSFSLSSKSRLSRKIEESIGFKDGTYFPSPTKAYNRISLKYGSHFQLGVLLEKDSGEREFDDLNLYFISFRDRSNKNKLILGNYRLEFAKGLIFGNPYGYYKGGNPIYPAKRRGRNLTEYTLVDENASLYGIASQICFEIYQFNFFYSSNKLDATMNSDGSFRNFYSTGYHRTPVELEKKDKISEQLIGGRFQLKPASYFSIGATYYQSKFYNFVKNEWQKNPLVDKPNELIGIDYDLTFDHFNLFGEFARSKNGGYGFLTGFFFDVQPLQFVILARNYSQNFNSLHGNSFAEHGDHPQNEQGIFAGFRLKLLKHLKMNIYFDQFRFPWKTYFVPMPSNGNDFLIKVDHAPLKNFSVSIKFKSSQKDRYFSEIKSIIPRNQKNLRLQVEFQPWNEIKLRQRLEKNWVTYKFYKSLQQEIPDAFKGILLYQDIMLHINKNFQITTRISFFDTDSYESRLYQFEHDVPGMLTNQMLYGMGNRWYIKILWNISSSIRASMKMGTTQYHHIQHIGSYSDMIPGNSLHSINLQIETKW